MSRRGKASVRARVHHGLEIGIGRHEAHDMRGHKQLARPLGSRPLMAAAVGRIQAHRLFAQDMEPILERLDAHLAVRIARRADVERVKLLLFEHFVEALVNRPIGPCDLSCPLGADGHRRPQRARHLPHSYQQLKWHLPIPPMPTSATRIISVPPKALCRAEYPSAAAHLRSRARW